MILKPVIFNAATSVAQTLPQAGRPAVQAKIARNIFVPSTAVAMLRLRKILGRINFAKVRAILHSYFMSDLNRTKVFLEKVTGAKVSVKIAHDKKVITIARGSNRKTVVRMSVWKRPLLVEMPRKSKQKWIIDKHRSAIIALGSAYDIIVILRRSARIMIFRDPYKRQLIFAGRRKDKPLNFHLRRGQLVRVIGAGHKKRKAKHSKKFRKQLCRREKQLCNLARKHCPAANKTPYCKQRLAICARYNKDCVLKRLTPAAKKLMAGLFKTLKSSAREKLKAVIKAQKGKVTLKRINKLLKKNVPKSVKKQIIKIQMKGIKKFKDSLTAKLPPNIQRLISIKRNALGGLVQIQTGPNSFAHHPIRPNQKLCVVMFNYLKLFYHLPLTKLQKRTCHFIVIGKPYSIPYYVVGLNNLPAIMLKEGKNVIMLKGDRNGPALTYEVKRGKYFVIVRPGPKQVFKPGKSFCKGLKPTCARLFMTCAHKMFTNRCKRLKHRCHRFSRQCKIYVMPLWFAKMLKDAVDKLPPAQHSAVSNKIAQQVSLLGPGTSLDIIISKLPKNLQSEINKKISHALKRQRNTIKKQIPKGLANKI